MKSSASGLLVYQGIAFVALLAALYVATPGDLRFKVIAISAVVGLVALAASRLIKL